MHIGQLARFKERLQSTVFPFDLERMRPTFPVFKKAIQGILATDSITLNTWQFDKIVKIC
jgi:hypothetical protein